MKFYQKVRYLTQLEQINILLKYARRNNLVVYHLSTSHFDNHQVIYASVGDDTTEHGYITIYTILPEKLHDIIKCAIPVYPVIDKIKKESSKADKL